LRQGGQLRPPDRRPGELLRGAAQLRMAQHAFWKSVEELADQSSK
jgi:hypothetical protein